MTIPIATSPGRSGFGPQLSLSYDSGSGNGPFDWLESFAFHLVKPTKAFPNTGISKNQMNSFFPEQKTWCLS